MGRPRRILLGLSILILSACQPSGMQLTGGIPTLETQRCARAGGFLDQRGRRGNLMCVYPFADAGKACSSTKDCQGRCLAVSGGGGLPKAGEEAAGRCQPDDKLFGCFAELDKGKVKSTMCID